MKIECIRTYHLRSELDQPFGFSQWSYSTRNALLVEIVADHGTAGGASATGRPRSIKLRFPVSMRLDGFVAARSSLTRMIKGFISSDFNIYVYDLADGTEFGIPTPRA